MRTKQPGTLTGWAAALTPPGVRRTGGSGLDTFVERTASVATWANIDSRARALVLACTAHVLHDGYTDLLYVILPLWQREFGLTLAAVGLLRSLYTGAMATFQIPSAIAAERFGATRMLAIGTAFAAGCYLVAAGKATTYETLALALFAGGLGSSVQHPVSSNLVARAFSGAASRVALGTYNFSGDIGKIALPAAAAAMLVVLPWHSVLWIVGGIGLCVAVVIAALGPPASSESKPKITETQNAAPMFTIGFSSLLGIGAIDSAVRMGFLTFLPFVLTHRGATIATIGFALSLVFAGGAAGKFVCGYLGSRIGVLATVCLTEALTAVAIVGLLPLSLPFALALLPFLGIALNGTSSVLYGSVPEVVAKERRQRAFGVFYTAGVGAGAISPVASGAFSDAFGIPLLMTVLAGLALVTIPLAAVLSPRLRAAS